MRPLLERVWVRAELDLMELVGAREPDSAHSVTKRVRAVIDLIPPAIADRLEYELGSCGFMYGPPDYGSQFPCSMRESAHGKTDHLFVPLVTPREEGANK